VLFKSRYQNTALLHKYVVASKLYFSKNVILNKIILREIDMPYKLRNNLQHKFKKVNYKITNWLEYNDVLIKRSDVTVWLSPGIIKAWHIDKNKLKTGQAI